jgi:hypothetical protein
MVLFVPLAYSLTTWDAWFAAQPDEAKKMQPVAVMVRGTGTNDYYVLEADPTTGALAVTTATATKTMSYKDRHDYTVNVTTAAYTELIASTAAAIYVLNIFDSSGETMILATGAAASETDLLYIPPGGFNAPMEIYIAAGTRLSIKALSATATSGEIVLNATN